MSIHKLSAPPKWSMLMTMTNDMKFVNLHFIAAVEIIKGDKSIRVKSDKMMLK